MTILRKVQRHNYTVIENELLVDDRLSYRARGIAAYLISKPDDWSVNIRHLMGAGSEGRQAIVTALHELATLGYMKRERKHENGQIGTYTYVADWPAFENDGTPEERIRGYAIEPTPDVQEPDPPETGASETGDSDSRPSQNRAAIVNTEIPITDVVNTERTNERARAHEDVPLTKSDPRVAALRKKLHSVGVMITEHTIETYMALVEDDGIDFEYVLRGITAAAETQKQHRMKYVIACIRNQAAGVTPEQIKAKATGESRTGLEKSIERTLAYTEGAPVKYNTHVNNGNGWNLPDATH